MFTPAEGWSLFFIFVAVIVFSGLHFSPADEKQDEYCILKPFSSPPQMLGGYGDFMYQTGLIDEHQRQYVIQQTDLGVELIHQQKWVEAFQVGGASVVQICMTLLMFNKFLFLFSHLFLHIADHVVTV